LLAGKRVANSFLRFLTISNDLKIFYYQIFCGQTFLVVRDIEGICVDWIIVVLYIERWHMTGRWNRIINAACGRHTACH